MSRRTPGPWALRGYQIRAEAGRGAHVATYSTNAADGRAIAALPEILDLLSSACASLDACESGASAHGTAVDIRARMCALGVWRDPTPAHDAHLIYHDHDRIDLDPDLPSWHQATRWSRNPTCGCGAPATGEDGTGAFACQAHGGPAPKEKP